MWVVETSWMFVSSQAIIRRTRNRETIESHNIELLTLYTDTPKNCSLGSLLFWAIAFSGDLYAVGCSVIFEL